MRSKEEAHDYRYFPDPDLLPLEFDQAYVDALARHLPELPDAKKARFVDAITALSTYDADVLVAETRVRRLLRGGRRGPRRQAGRQLGHQRAVRAAEQGRQGHATLARFGRAARRDHRPHRRRHHLRQDRQGSLRDPLERGRRSGEIVEERGLKQVTDTGAIEKAVDEVIAANPDKVEQAVAKPTMAGWFVGQVMKATGGKANPQAVNELVKAKLGISRRGSRSPARRRRRLAARRGHWPFLRPCSGSRRHCSSCSATPGDCSSRASRTCGCRPRHKALRTSRPAFTGKAWRSSSSSAASWSAAQSGARFEERRFEPRSYLTSRFVRIYLVFLPALALTLLLDHVGRSVFLDTRFYGVRPLMPMGSPPAGAGGNCLPSREGLQGIVCMPIGANLPLWSLGFEWVFYLLAPVLFGLALAGRWVSSGVGGIVLVLPGVVHRHGRLFGLAALAVDLGRRRLAARWHAVATCPLRWGSPGSPVILAGSLISRLRSFRP